MSIQVPPFRHGLVPTQASCSENQIIICHVTGGVVDRGVVSGIIEEIAFLTVDNIVDVVEEMVNIGVYTGIFGQSASNTE